MISIVVCTRNRSDLLSLCIQSLLNQCTSVLYEIIIVDNASTDNTKEIVSAFINTDSRVSYIYEATPSSSKARNTGVSIARYNFLGFIDDDGKVRSDFIEYAAHIIKGFSFDCFGGWFIPWYIAPKPKWFLDEYGSYPCFLSETGILENHHVPCGILFVKKSIFTEVGGFSEHIGMKGDIMGFGEENLLQDSIRKKGGLIGFSPDLILEHYVAEYKYDFKWHIKRFYAKGRDTQSMIGGLSQKKRMLYRAKAISLCFFMLLRNFPRLIKNNYYLQNWLLDSLRYSVHLLGRASVK